MSMGGYKGYKPENCKGGFYNDEKDQCHVHGSNCYMPDCCYCGLYVPTNPIGEKVPGDGRREPRMITITRWRLLNEQR
jgi:hypothetical protein